jgi:hypothetical protein
MAGGDNRARKIKAHRSHHRRRAAPHRGAQSRRPVFKIRQRVEECVMGELLDRLNAMDARLRAPGEPIEPIRSASDQVARAFRSASQRVNEAIDAVQEPGMPLDTLSRWTRQAPLQALAVAFLVGALFTRRRRGS